MSALKPYEPTSAHLDTREKLEAYILNAGHDNSTEEIFGWLDRQAAITEREITSSGVADWCASCEREQRIGKLQSRLDMAHETIDGLRESLNETIAERNELQAKLEEFDGDCYCGATVTEWYDLAVRLQAELEAKEQLERDSAYMRLPVDANGVPCRIGDMLDGDGGRHEVMAVSEDCVWFDTDAHELRLTCFESSGCRHAKQETVEGVLQELADEVWEASCTCQATWSNSGLDGIAERYAERIRQSIESERN